MHRNLIIFAREPVAGRTKTRLCPPLDGATAAALYEGFLRDALHLARQISGVRVTITYTPESHGDFFARLAPDVEAQPQHGADLGERMDNALGEPLDNGVAQVVVIGSDSPNLPANYLQMAFSYLDAGANVVLGPSDDGGYYLIGLRSRQPRLLHEVRMSTSTVLADTLVIAKELGLRVALLPGWYDVDTAAELRRLTDDLRDAPADVAVHTREIVSRIAYQLESVE